MAIWRIRHADEPQANEDGSPTGELYNDGQTIEPGEDGFLDVINTILDGTDLAATYVSQ